MVRTTLIVASVSILLALAWITAQWAWRVTASPAQASAWSPSPEGRQIFPNLRVWENLEVARPSSRHTGAGKRGGEWDVERVFALFPALAERKHSAGSQLSGGEQQMLAIGRALMTEPSLMILDEATEGLAPLVRTAIWQSLEALKAQGQSILLIDKNLDALLRVADRHYVMEKGRVVWQGESAALANDECLKNRYLGV